MARTQPIRPDEVVDKLEEALPPYVVKAVNNLVAKKWTGTSAQFNMDDLRNEVNNIKAYDDLPIVHFPTNFEPIFRKAGWKVERDRPGYDENYPTNWTFSKEN